MPTERRVRRWALNVVELTRDPIGRQVLETFLESEFSSENIRFWMTIQDLKYAPNCQIEMKAQRVHDEYCTLFKTKLLRLMIFNFFSSQWCSLPDQHRFPNPGEHSSAFERGFCRVEEICLFAS